MVERDRRDLLEPEAPGREHPPVAGQHAAAPVDEDRHDEPERRDALGDAHDLPEGMNAGVPAVGPQSLERQPADLDPRGRPARLAAVAPQALRRPPGAPRVGPGGGGRIDRGYEFGQISHEAKAPCVSEDMGLILPARGARVKNKKRTNAIFMLYFNAIQ